MRVTLDGSYQNHTMFTGNQFIQNQVLSIFSSSWLRKQSSTYGLNPHPTPPPLNSRPTQNISPGAGQGGRPLPPDNITDPGPRPSPASGIGVKQPQVTYSPAWGKGEEQAMVLTLTSPKEKDSSLSITFLQAPLTKPWMKASGLMEESVHAFVCYTHVLFVNFH